jgi:hypothetical protein
MKLGVQFSKLSNTGGTPPMKLLLASLTLFAITLLLSLYPAASSCLSTDYLRDVRGGDPKPNCYVDGTANCPDPTGACSDNPCPGNPPVCPNNLTRNIKSTSTYAAAQLTTTEPGHVNITPQAAIYCANQYACGPTCSFFDPGGFRCDVGALIGPTTSRTPTVVNTSSAQCNTP